MSDLIGTVNCGFRIIKQGKKAVIGEKPDGQYVAWNYRIDNGEPSYYWGHYGIIDKNKITKVFTEKEAR